MTTQTITREEFNAWANANRHNDESEAHEDAGTLIWDDDDDELESPFDQLCEYLRGIEAVNEQHGIVITDDAIMFTTEGLDAAYAVYNRVVDDYNGSNGRSTHDPDSPWTLYNLRGDEDVDCSGSHPVIGIDLIKAVLADR